MSTHDTDPQRSSLFAGSGDTTEPGPPPEVTGASADGDGNADAQLAASLLADLAKAPLPTEGVRETEGHSAAAIALPAHRPPRAMGSGAAEPAVLLNTTEPLPRPAPMLVGVPVPPESKGLEGRRSAVQYSTVPSARVHRRQTAAVVIVIAIAALAAAAIVAFVPRAGTLPPEPAALTTPPTVSTAPLAPTSSATASVAAATSPPRPAASVSATPALVVASAQAPAAPSTARAPAIVTATASTPRPAASVPRAPRSPSGGFEEPDRNF